MEKINIENYQEFAMRTLTPACNNIDYATFGLQSEVAELLAKFCGRKAKMIRGDSAESIKQIESAIVGECGDVFWMCALFAKLLNLDFVRDFKAGRKNEYLQFTPFGFSYANVKIFDLYCDSLCLANMALFIIGVSVEDCLTRNILKLADRYNRNVINGNGDER